MESRGECMEVSEVSLIIDLQDVCRVCFVKIYAMPLCAIQARPCVTVVNLFPWISP